MGYARTNTAAHGGDPARARDDHDRSHRKAQALLDELRGRLGIPHLWQVELQICCEDELPDSYGECLFEYTPNMQYLIRLRCDLAGTALYYTIGHELLEAIRAPSAELTYELIQKLHGPAGARPNKTAAALYAQRDAVAGNQMVEWLARLVLHMERPRALTPFGPEATGKEQAS